jgi:Peptidase A4 family
VRRPLSIALAGACLLLFAPSALADTSNSTNWAGYAVHGSGEQFNFVSGAWRQPPVSCRPGRRTYSAYWIGLGGYRLTSNALEQIGTEADCSSGGQAVLSAWYELVPAPSIPVHMTIAAGDQMRAQVAVSGRQVVLTLADLSRQETFSKPLRAHVLDLSSAEWIVEAPSECIGAYSCQTLPLANFGAATFTSAAVKSGTGHQGTISDSGWSSTKIVLRPAGRELAHLGATLGAGAASPSGLQQDGSSFRVAYRRVSMGHRAGAAHSAVSYPATQVRVGPRRGASPG